MVTITQNTEQDKVPTDTEEWEKSPRRPRGYLESDILRVCQAFISGAISLSEGVYLTPHIAALQLAVIDCLQPDDIPSCGAVAAIFNRWEASGTARFRKNPRAFVSFIPQE